MYTKLTSRRMVLKMLALLSALFVSFIYTTHNVEAASVAFDFEHDCVAAPSLCAVPIGMLTFTVDTPASVPPSSLVPMNFWGVAAEPLGSVPICPIMSYGGSGVGSMGPYQPIPGDVGNCFTKNYFLTTAPMYFTAPATPGTHSFCASGDTSNVEYMEINGTQCMDYQVGAPAVGNINVSANIAGASWTLSGPTLLAGSGLSQSYTSVPTGMYTLTFNAVAGYTTPPSQVLTLNSGGTINFAEGNYTLIPVTVGGSLSPATSWINPSNGYVNLEGSAWDTSRDPIYQGVYVQLSLAPAGIYDSVDQYDVTEEPAVINCQPGVSGNTTFQCTGTVTFANNAHTIGNGIHVRGIACNKVFTDPSKVCAPLGNMTVLPAPAVDLKFVQ